MAIELDPSATPPSYPRGGTYADLLWWHLFINGTGAKPGHRWERKEFAGKIFGDRDPDKDGRNLRNWLGRGSPPGDPVWIARIEEALFDDDPAMRQWKTDLRLAHERSRGKGKNKRTIDLSLSESQPATAVDKNILLSSASNVLNQITEKAHEFDWFQERAMVLAEEGEIERGRESFIWSAHALRSIIGLYRTHLHLFSKNAQREIDDMLGLADKGDEDSTFFFIKAVQTIHREIETVVETLRQ